MKKRTRRHAAFLATIVTLNLAGCGYFSPREPDEPGQPPDRHAPTAPDSVLFNFAQALREKVLGAPQLSESLDPDFIMVLDVEDSRRLNGLKEIFKQDFERANRDFLSLRVQGNELTFVFDTTAVPVMPVTADSAFYDNLPYTMLIFPPGQSVAIDSIKGEVDLGMRKDTNWAIATWIDFDRDVARTETYGYYMGFYSGLTAPGDILK